VKRTVPVGDMNLVMTLTKMLEVLLEPEAS